MRLGLLESSHRESPAHGWKVIKELFQGMAGFDVVNQRLNRDPRSDEYRGAPQDVGVGVNNGRFVVERNQSSKLRNSRRLQSVIGNRFLNIQIRATFR